MKRFFTFLTIAAALLAVSCAKEQEGPSAGKAMVTYTIDGPVQVATKAMGTIGTAYTLYYEVRLWDGSVLGNKLEGTGLSGSKEIAANAWPTTVSFDLARGKQYKILFWAQSNTAPAGLYDCSDLTAIAIDYSNMAASNEDCDAFYGSDVITPAGATAASATLYRPFALVNLGTSDAAQFHTASGGCTVGDVKVTINGSLANSFNVATGEPGAGVATNFAPNAAPIDAYDAKTLVVGETSFNYLSAVYVLPAGASDVIEVAYDIKDNATTPADITSLTVSNVPVHANFRTNITGKLLTGTTTYEISVDQDFAGNTNKEATPTFSSIAALNTFFASNLATGPNDPDNGDIYPETVTVTAIPDGDATTITLPNDTLSVAINILASYSAEEGLTIAYPTAEGAKHSNKVFFNMSGLSKLTANLPDTHLEVVSGSSIDLSDVHTSASTFVVQKNARVGELNIKQGNAKIAGAINSLKVNPAATSDGAAAAENNAVQVFLEKDSAVEKIILYAKTDVVVEQPKDQIEVEETEKKVAVYVNDGAANSTATAQNGGVIYVEANVPCSVTADGVSTADEGTVSSTVIVNEGAAGSSVVASNGGAINLEANADCSASADGVAEGPGSEPDIPSTINVTEVKDENIVIDANTSEGGEIDTTPETSGAVKYYVAQIVGGAKYESLYDAVAAAESGANVEMINNSTETTGFTLSKSLTIDLCEFTVTFDSGTGSVDTGKFPNSRAIKIGGDSAVAVTIENGTIVVGDNVYGPFRIENGNADVVLDKLVLNNSMAYGLGTKIVNAHSVAISNTVVNSVVGGGIEKGCDTPTTLTNVTVNQTEDDTQHPYISTAISTEYGGPLTVASGSYSGRVAAYLFSSGGTMNINGGSFTGREAAIRVQNNTQEQGWAGASIINISAGTFVGPLILDAWGAANPVPRSEMNISGGTFTTTTGQGPLFQVNGNYSHLTITGGYFSDDPTPYLGSGSMVIENPDANANVYPYKVVPSECNVYTPAVEASVDNNDIVFNRVKTGLTKKTFAQAVATATAGQVIELSGDIDCSGQTINVAGGVAIDFAGYTLTADKVVGNNGNVLFKQSKKYDSIEAAAAEVAQGYLSYVGSIENVEIWGGTYAFDPQDYTPSGLALVANGAAYEMPGKWFVPSIPEALVYHGTQQEMEDNNISFKPGILAIERNGGEALINLSNPVGQLSLPIQNGAYAFLSDDDESPLTSLSYQSWIADFIVSINQDTDIAGIVEGSYNTQYPIPSWGIWGAYGGMQFAPALCFNLKANERFPLLGSMGMGWDYYQMRNTVHTFICGAVNVHPENVGKVVTAELCIAPDNYSSMAEAIAAGEYIVVGKYQYTMEEPYYDITQFPDLIVQ